MGDFIRVNDKVIFREDKGFEDKTIYTVKAVDCSNWRFPPSIRLDSGKSAAMNNLKLVKGE